MSIITQIKIGLHVFGVLLEFFDLILFNVSEYIEILSIK